MLELIVLAAVMIDLIYIVILVFINLPPHRPEIKKLQRVSVIIAAKDGDVIERTLRYLKKVRAPRLEIIVVSSSGKTLKIARKYGAKAVKDSGIGKGPALNAAVRRSTCKILYFMDEDMIVGGDTIEK